MFMLVLIKGVEYAIDMKAGIGSTSLEVIKEIVSRHPEIARIKLILHGVQLNWGQRYDTNDKILAHFEESLIQEIPLEERWLDRVDFLTLGLGDLEAGDHQVWSFTSKVQADDGAFFHIPMMNFHPLDGAGVNDILRYIKLAEPGRRGWVLESGRYFHLYIDALLSEADWIQFNARFLMPLILVRSRYIGHRLRDGYSTLRLTNDTTYKPKIPTVIELIG